MKADIHPKYEAITATCSCGNTVQTRSTRCEDFHVDVCSLCHPFYTGKQKTLDTGGRVDRFMAEDQRMVETLVPMTPDIDGRGDLLLGSDVSTINLRKLLREKRSKGQLV